MEVNQVNQQETLPLGWQRAQLPSSPGFPFFWNMFHSIRLDEEGGVNRWKVVSDFIDLNPPIGSCFGALIPSTRRTYALPNRIPTLHRSSMLLTFFLFFLF